LERKDLRRRFSMTSTQRAIMWRSYWSAFGSRDFWPLGFSISGRSPVSSVTGAIGAPETLSVDVSGLLTERGYAVQARWCCPAWRRQSWLTGTHNQFLGCDEFDKKQAGGYTQP
jgi:hypothetical protein